MQVEQKEIPDIFQTVHIFQTYFGIGICYQCKNDPWLLQTFSSYIAVIAEGMPV